VSLYIVVIHSAEAWHLSYETLSGQRRGQTLMKERLTFTELSIKSVRYINLSFVHVWLSYCNLVACYAFTVHYTVTEHGNKTCLPVGEAYSIGCVGKFNLECQSALILQSEHSDLTMSVKHPS
jgi:hypothetical protein